MIVSKQKSVETHVYLQLKPSESLTWTACYDGHECARLTLPLDYDVPDGPKTHIALRKYPATDKADYKGAVLINPGGPGGSGTNLVARAGESLSLVIGPQYDIVGFDPRGIGATVPSAQCFDSDSQFQIWNLQQGRNLNVSDWSTVAYEQARWNLVGERCEGVLGGTGEQKVGGTAEEWGSGKFMSSRSVAMDVVRMTEAFGQDKINWYGFVSVARFGSKTCPHI